MKRDCSILRDYDAFLIDIPIMLISGEEGYGFGRHIGDDSFLYKMYATIYTNGITKFVTCAVG